MIHQAETWLTKIRTATVLKIYTSVYVQEVLGWEPLVF